METQEGEERGEQYQFGREDVKDLIGMDWEGCDPESKDRLLRGRNKNGFQKTNRLSVRRNKAARQEDAYWAAELEKHKAEIEAWKRANGEQ